MLKRISTKIEGTYSEEKLLAFNTVYSIYCKDKETRKEDLLAVLGILNSKLMHFFYEYSYNVGMNLTTQVTIDFLSKIPIKNRNNKQNKYLAELVSNEISLKEKLNGMSETDQKIKLEEKIAELDKQIDEQVYELYGINEKEKKIIGDGLKPHGE